MTATPPQAKLGEGRESDELGLALRRLGGDLFDDGFGESHDHGLEPAIEALQQHFRSIGEADAILVGTALEAGQPDLLDGPHAVSLAHGLAEAFQYHRRLSRHADGKVAAGSTSEAHGPAGKALEGELFAGFGWSGTIRFKRIITHNDLLHIGSTPSVTGIAADRPQAAHERPRKICAIVVH